MKIILSLITDALKQQHRDTAVCDVSDDSMVIFATTGKTTVNKCAHVRLKGVSNIRFMLINSDGGSARVFEHNINDPSFNLEEMIFEISKVISSEISNYWKYNTLDYR